MKGFYKYAAFTMTLILIGCTNIPSPNNPSTREYRQSNYSRNLMPVIQKDGSVIVARTNKVIFRIMPMTSGSPKGAVRPNDEINELIKENEEILNNNPKNIDACLMLASLYLDRKFPSDAVNAVKYSTMALEIQKDNPIALLARSLGYMENNENEKALNDLKSVMLLNEQSIKTASYLTGAIYYREWEKLNAANKTADASSAMNSAIEAFEKVKALDPNFIDTNEILSVLYRRK